MIHDITIFEVLIYATTIHLFRNLPLQFSHSLNRVILYVFDALGPTCRPPYFRMVHNAHTASLLSTGWRLGPTPTSSFLPPTPAAPQRRRCRTPRRRPCTPPRRLMPSAWPRHSFLPSPHAPIKGQLKPLRERQARPPSHHCRCQALCKPTTTLRLPYAPINP